MSLERVWRRIFRAVHGIPANEPHECMYGDDLGAEENCTVVVPPHQGVRGAGSVYCSEDHWWRAREDLPM